MNMKTQMNKLVGYRTGGITPPVTTRPTLDVPQSANPAFAEYQQGYFIQIPPGSDQYHPVGPPGTSTIAKVYRRDQIPEGSPIAPSGSNPKKFALDVWGYGVPQGDQLKTYEEEEETIQEPLQKREGPSPGGGQTRGRTPKGMVISLITPRTTAGDLDNIREYVSGVFERNPNSPYDEKRLNTDLSWGNLAKEAQVRLDLHDKFGWLTGLGKFSMTGAVTEGIKAIFPDTKPIEPIDLRNLLAKKAAESLHPPGFGGAIDAEPTTDVPTLERHAVATRDVTPTAAPVSDAASRRPPGFGGASPNRARTTRDRVGGYQGFGGVLGHGGFNKGGVIKNMHDGGLV